MKKIFNIIFIGISLTLIHGCSDNYPVPPASTVPKFSSTGDAEFAPVTITFKNESIVPKRAGTVTYYWNFGDGTTLSGENPSHYYKTAGVYKVNLVVVTELSNEINEVSQDLVIKDPNAKGTPVFFTNGSTILGGLINEYAPVVSSIGITTLQDSYGMALDTVNDILYIADFDGGKIYTVNTDGSDFKTFRSGVGQPDGIAIDYTNQMIYWDTDEGIRRATIANTDIGQYEDFVTGQGDTDGAGPEGLGIDQVNKKLYWNNYDGGVWSKNLDGTDEKQIVTTSGGGSVIVVDDRIYFDDYAAKGDIRLKSANLDGTSVATLATNISKVVYGLAYDADQSKIYWVDRDKGIIMRSDKNGDNAEPWYTNTSISPRGIVIGKKQK